MRGTVYYKLDIRCLGRMGLNADILRILAEAECAIMDFRMDNQNSLAVFEARVLPAVLLLCLPSVPAPACVSKPL